MKVATETPLQKRITETDMVFIRLMKSRGLSSQQVADLIGFSISAVNYNLRKKPSRNSFRHYIKDGLKSPSGELLLTVWIDVSCESDTDNREMTIDDYGIVHEGNSIKPIWWTDEMRRREINKIRF